MPIVINLDVELAKKKMSVTDFAAAIDITPANVSVLKNGRALVLEGAVARSSAILVSWFLGVETGNALADILFGDYGPSGRLPLTAEMLRQEPSGNLFGLTQNVGMGWSAGALEGPQYLIVSTLGGLRALASIGANVPNGGDFGSGAKTGLVANGFVGVKF